MYIRTPRIICTNESKSMSYTSLTLLLPFTSTKKTNWLQRILARSVSFLHPLIPRVHTKPHYVGFRLFIFRSGLLTIHVYQYSTTEL